VPKKMEGLPEGVLHEIFLFCGGRSATIASMTCKAWCLRPSSPIYRHFIRHDFGLDVEALPGLDVTSSCDFQSLYGYLQTCFKSSTIRSLLPGAKIEFADDGGNYPGFPPENILKEGVDNVYCTANEDKDVDVLIKLRAPSIVTDIGASNAGVGFSNLLHSAVAFSVIQNPRQHLDDARDYNGCKPSEFEQTPHKLQPLGTIEFPEWPHCKNASVSTKAQPSVACFVHFKLLSSFNPNKQRVNNIDLGGVHIKGMELDDLITQLSRAFQRPIAEVQSALLSRDKDYSRTKEMHGSLSWFDY